NRSCGVPQPYRQRPFGRRMCCASPRCGTRESSVAIGDTPVLQHLVDLKPEVKCDSAHGALTDVVQQLLVIGHPAIEIVSVSESGGTAEANAVFDRVRNILVHAHL